MAVTADDLERVYRAEFTTMAQTAAAIVDDAQLGHDVVQTAFVNALRKRSAYRADGTLSAWVWTIVINEARSQARRTPPTLFDGDPPDAAAPAQARHVAEIRRLVAGLPERQRTAIFLRYYADFSNTRIAQVLGIRPGTVGALLSQAHATLRDRLREVIE